VLLASGAELAPGEGDGDGGAPLPEAGLASAGGVALGVDPLALVVVAVSAVAGDVVATADA
jgi:hypothetical protein